MSGTVYGGDQVKSQPKVAPCGHVPPVFLTKGGSYRAITLPPQESQYLKLSPSVWCGEGCGWVNVTNEDYEYYRGFDGAQET